MAAAACVCGCQEEEGADAAKRGQRSRATETPSAAVDRTDYTKLDANAVLVRIGTNEITKAQVEKLIDLRMKVIRIGIGEANKKFALNRGAVWMPLVASLPESYRREVALLKWAAENGIKPDAKDIAEFKKGFLRGCRAEFADYAAFMKKNFTADERRTAAARIAVEATCAKVRRTYLSQNPVTVKKDEAEAFLKRVVDYNARAEATNVLVWAKASNLWEQVKGGEDFKLLARKFTEVVSEQDDDGSWGVYSLGDLEKAEEGAVAQKLATLAVGETTPPVELDNGVAIVRIDGVSDSHGNPLPSGARPFSALYELSRIYLRLALTYEIPEANESESEMRAYHEQVAFAKFTSGLIEKDGVEYPCGKEVFENAKERSKMPQMLMQEGVTPEMLEKARKSGAK